MQVTFWGAARTVTGSQHLLESGGERVLLDCGTYQGKRAEANAINRTLPFDAKSLSGMVLSHAHIDHSGNIPNLVKSGYQGKIHCTRATQDLCDSMLMDSGKIQEEDAKFLNKHGATPQVMPIYTQLDAQQSLERFVSHDYKQPFEATNNVRVTYNDAGHMLGSAWELIELNEGGRQARLCFSGDLGRFGLPILRDPQYMPEADYLIIEGTYGNRLHEPISDALPTLDHAIHTAVERGGKVVIPAFAVGRTQEIVYCLHQLILQGHLPDVPVFVDSPLAVNVTRAFREHPECYDGDTKVLMRQSPNGDAFGFPRLKYVRTVEESKALNFVKGPAVIISASGMCENGRVLHHLRNTIEDERNMVLLVSFQAPDTLGRKLQDGVKTVRILGDEFRVRAEVRRAESFSGHADRNDLLNWVAPRAKQLRKVFIVHAEEDSALALADGLREIGVSDVQVPFKGQSFEL